MVTQKIIEFEPDAMISMKLKNYPENYEKCLLDIKVFVESLTEYVI